MEQPVYLWSAARILQEVGAQDAMCLDGGMSSGLFSAGKTHLKPRRSLTNVLVVYTSTSRFEHYAARLNPPGATIAQEPSDHGPG